MCAWGKQGGNHADPPIPIPGDWGAEVEIVGLYPSRPSQAAAGSCHCWFRLRVGPVMLTEGRLMERQDGTARFVMAPAVARFWGRKEIWVRHWRLDPKCANAVRAALETALGLETLPEQDDHDGARPMKLI